MSAVTLRRPASIPPRSDRRVGAIPVLLVIASLIATCAGPTPSASPAGPDSPAGSPASSLPVSTPGVTPLPTDPPEVTGWARLDLPVLAQVASLEATKTGPASVAPSTAFRLTSLAGTPVRQLAKRLVSTPALDLQVARVSGDTAVLRPVAPLRRGQIYRFELRREDGSAEAAWAVQAAWPLRVASSLPGDTTTDVRRTTGVEVTFDQPGVAMGEFRSHFSISPTVKGTFEQHGQTFVFVPIDPLARSTLYTVTVRHGLPLAGTGMRLEQDEVIRFETTGEKVSRVHMSVTRPLFDAATHERPVLSVNAYSDGEDGQEEQVSRLAVRVFRLPGLTAAIDAYRRVHAAPDWSERSSTTPVKTASLPLVLQATVRLQRLEYDETRWFRLPRTLRAGWYVVVVTHAGISRQAVLQVTDLAAFSIAGDNRSLVWVNDVRSNDPVAGARVSLAGKSLGRTNAEGLVTGRTPALLASGIEGDEDAFAIVRSGSRTMFLPLEGTWSCRECERAARDQWWQLLTLDRDRYRSSDTIHVWGVVRDRDAGRVPAAVTVRLEPSQDYGLLPLPSIASATATPDRSGAFLGRLSFADVPPGGYVVTVRVGTETVATRWLEIGPIVKPAWKLDLSVPRHAVLNGAELPISATATFFEGTPVAGAALRYSPENYGEDDGQNGTPITATSDANGSATATVPLRRYAGDDEGEGDQWSTVSVYVRANEPEEAAIEAEIPVMVFASTAVLDTDSTLAGHRLTASGALHSVVFERYEEPGVDLWSVDPRGAPRAGASVKVHVTENIPVYKRTGTRYDFIAKEVVPVYEVDERHVDLGSRTVVTRADGTFRLSMTVEGGDRSYTVTASYTDEGGRQVSQASHASSGISWYDSEPGVVATDSLDSYGEYRVGDTVSVRFRNGIKDPEVSRYLFAVMARGLLDVSVQGGARFTTPFTRRLVPNAHITGVRFTGTGYEVDLNGFGASLRTDDRALQVQLAADRARYRPGDRVTVSVRTLDASGRPVAASVFVRTVDEKLFAIGAASVDDPLPELYEGTGSGMVASAWSHKPPTQDYGDGKGDTTGGGGGGRDDFRDWLLAQLVTTDSDGRATVSFNLSDDLTSWRVLASAVTPDLRAGRGAVSVPVGLPFFVEAVVAHEYLAVDRPLVRLRAYGSALTAGDPVTFQVSSPTLPMTVVTVGGTAFEPVEVALPALAVGTHRLRIQASSGTGAGQHSDALVKTFEVVKTRTVRSHTESVALTAGTTVGGADGLTTITLVDAGRGRVVPLLRELAVAEPFRADRALAAAIARDLLADAFGIPDNPGLGEPDIAAFQQGYGVSILPYASADLELTALAAFSGDRRLNRDGLHWYFQELVEESGGRLPVDRELYVLLGRASIGEATIGDVTAAAARSDLTPPQRTTVALAALAVGDQALAREIYLDLLGRYGERLGSWVRVKVGTAEQTAVTTARLAIVGASLGDPMAADMDAEVAAHPPKDTLVDLERVIAARYWADRMPATEAVAGVTIDGRRSEARITAGEPVVLAVTPAQRAGLRIDPVSGSVLVISQWDGALEAGDLTPPRGQEVTRTVAPAGSVGSTDTVVVTLKVTLGRDAEGGCWELTDVVPSGLAPVATPGRWQEEDEDQAEALGYAERPWSVVGQRVQFCVERDPKVATHTLRYLARVVTPGAYRWESAVLQSSLIPEQGTILPAFDLSIRGLGG